jgi:hypothetical protein
MALATDFQCLLQTLELIIVHLSFSKESQIDSIRDGYINWHQEIDHLSSSPIVSSCQARAPKRRYTLTVLIQTLSLFGEAQGVRSTEYPISPKTEPTPKLKPPAFCSVFLSNPHA